VFATVLELERHIEAEAQARVEELVAAGEKHKTPTAEAINNAEKDSGKALKKA
jgi:hypothetical protein